MTKILVLGGTTDASRLAGVLAAAGIAAVLSYAGRTEAPRAQPLPTRIGGFGGPEGLAQYLTREGITHLIDATHPFAASISANALRAAALTRTPLIALERDPWQPRTGDRWTVVPDIAAAAAALPPVPARVFLAIGRMHLGDFAHLPRHHYLLRLVDAPAAALPLPDATAIIARGPFTMAGDLALLRDHRISHVVAKNAGGEGARAKIDAARHLGLPVIMIDRPALAPRPLARGVDQVMNWLAAHADLGV